MPKDKGHLASVKTNITDLVKFCSGYHLTWLQESNDPATVLSGGGLLPLGGMEATGIYLSTWYNRIILCSCSYQGK